MRRVGKIVDLEAAVPTPLRQTNNRIVKYMIDFEASFEVKSVIEE